MIRALIISLVFIFSSQAFAAEEMVKSFNAFVTQKLKPVFESCEDPLTHRYVYNRGQWHKFSDDVDKSYVVDLKKSDSLISPYVGVLTISKNEYTVSGPDKENLNTPTPFKSQEDIYTINIAWQENDWMVTTYKRNQTMFFEYSRPIVMSKTVKYHKQNFEFLNCHPPKGN